MRRAPRAALVKRSALGRMAHEGAAFRDPKAGKPIVVYMGDDSRDQYIYKFVSKANGPTPIVSRATVSRRATNTSTRAPTLFARQVPPRRHRNVGRAEPRQPARRWVRGLRVCRSRRRGGRPRHRLDPLRDRRRRQRRADGDGAARRARDTGDPQALLGRPRPVRDHRHRRDAGRKGALRQRPAPGRRASGGRRIGHDALREPLARRRRRAAPLRDSGDYEGRRRPGGDVGIRPVRSRARDRATRRSPRVCRDGAAAG